MTSATFSVAAVLSIASDCRAQPSADNSLAGEVNRLLERWEYFQELAVPAETSAKFLDVLLPPGVFDKARSDLGDLRLYDAKSREVPYALRVREAVFTDQTVAASEFNRARGPNDSAEVTLDLGPDAAENNAVEIGLPGVNFRRKAQLEGSADGNDWKTIVGHKDLVRFQANNRELEDRRVTYPPSRFRYLRLRVYPDGEVDTKPLELGEVSVHRKVEIPGELVTLPARLGAREPVRADNHPASGWIIDLDGVNQPCTKLLAQIGDREFARDYRVEAGGLSDSDEPFRYVASGQWSRRAGDAVRPLEANFPDARAARLKLIVTDFRNPPLEIESVEYAAPARQVVFARDSSLAGPLRLYYGNPQAEPPHYDVERNLPALIEPPPERLTLGPRQQNPDYEPAPLALTERLPWLIYVVLGAACLVLGLAILSLGRTAIALHDRAAAGAASVD